MISLQIRNKVSNSFPPAHVFRANKNRNFFQSTLHCADEIISNAIESDKPMLIGRLGGTEARVLGCYFDVFKGKSLWDPMSTIYSLATFPKRIKQLRNLSGVYPSNFRVIKGFISEQLEALSESDILATWGSTFTWAETMFQKSQNQNCIPHYFVAPWIETWETGNAESKPWALSLTGKNVLIISGFSQSFKSQHQRIEKVFPTPLYPKFKAEFINVPISLGGLSDGKTWLDHLDRIKIEMQSKDFDVALISAGAYSLPLAHHAKKLGKVGITCGGEMQLFFGVIGKRWEHTVKFSKYQNDYWIRPSEIERPANWREIENGCYW
jgi:hypothetical protein